MLTSPPSPRRRRGQDGVLACGIGWSAPHIRVNAGPAGRTPASASHPPRTPQLSSGAVVSSTDAAFPRTTASEQRWKSHSVSLRSPVTEDRRAPNSLRNALVVGPQDPLVSNATGSNLKRLARWSYLRRFASSASFAAPPAAVVAA